MAESMKGATFTFRGAEYTLPSVNVDDREQLHALANANALMNVRAAAKYLPPEVAGEELAEVRRLCATNYFFWDEPGGHHYRISREGLIRIVWLGLRRNHPPKAVNDPGITLELVRAMAEVDNGFWLQEQYELANPPDPTARQRQGTPAGGNSGPGSPGAGDSASTKSAF